VIDPSEVRARLDRVRQRIAQAGGDPARVGVLPVTKGFGPAAVTAALDAGCQAVGENYAQELLGKAAAIDALGGAPAWHFLGAVQRNKVRALAPLVACWQGVARGVEGEAIARHRPGAAVFVEVETTGAPGRHGCPPDDVAELVGRLAGIGLVVRGLMTVAPQDADGARAAFRRVRVLGESLGLAELSMGMTDDLELAVAEGSTLVRVGRALFGERPAR
jgi:hypothetical protein